MDADGLRALQAPLKDRYRAEPAAATAIGLAISFGRVSAEGDIDFRGALGVAKDAPVGFSDIRLTFDLDTDAPPEQLDTLLKLTQRDCVVLQTLKRPPVIAAALTRAGA
jgi:hypothetical protein